MQKQEEIYQKKMLLRAEAIGKSKPIKKKRTNKNASKGQEIMQLTAVLLLFAENLDRFRKSKDADIANTANELFNKAKSELSLHQARIKKAMN